MANWCEGNIRIRGAFKNVVELLKNVLTVVRIEWEGNECKTQQFPPIVKTDEDVVTFRSDTGEFWLKGTHRNFLDSAIEIWDNADDEGEWTWVIDGFRAAWSFTDSTSDKAYTKMAKDYGVDIKLFGIEQGMEFMQEIAYYRDGTREENETEFDDWRWECPFPEMGG